jgi:L-aspartate oxidase
VSNRVIVVGSGAAGLTAALVAARDIRTTVTLLTKGPLGESASRKAQGGVAVALFDDDSVEAHIADTLAAGAGLSDAAAATILCSEGPDRIRDLIDLGLDFDRADDGVTLARGLEAAHSSARVLHAGGDATGRAIIETLVAAVRHARVTVVEHAFVRDLVVRDGDVTGVVVIRKGAAETMETETETMAADAVIVATGGIGQVYRHTTNPAGATGDGVAAAMRAGARVVDAEFVQFHPTALAVEGTPLVTEAIRGEGATLLSRHGERFMLDVHPDAELAPRDIVARAIAQQMSLQDGEPVRLDATGIPREVLQRRFPGFTALCERHGLDPASTPVPVTPAAHYWMGGIEVDIHARTSIRGLFAVGEAACTGAHGANRLASNSLLETLVTAHRAAEALHAPWPQAPDAASDSVADGSGETVPLTRAALQVLMWQHAGLHRDTAGLAEAKAMLASATVAGDTITDLETRNLLTIARAVVAGAEARTVSVGAHHRGDSPSDIPMPTDREMQATC